MPQIATFEQPKTIDQRIAREQFDSWKDKESKYIKRGVLWNPADNVVALLRRKEGRDWIKHFFFGKNIVTDAGDTFYAQQAANETPTNDFTSANNRIELRATADTPAKADTYGDVASPVTATRKAKTSGYPKSNDTDTDNTGKAVDAVTWKYEWTTGDFTQTGIVGGAIHNAAGSPVAGSALLTHYTIATFDKGGTDTLTKWINHTMNGV